MQNDRSVRRRRSVVGTASKPTHRTPSTFKFRGAEELDAAHDNDADADLSELVVCRTSMKQYRSTPMFGLKLERRFLKRVQRQLDRQFRQNLRPNEAGSDVKTTISLIPNSFDEVIGFTVSVLKNTETKNEIFWGLWCSHTLNSDKQDVVLPDGFIYYPLILVKGNQFGFNNVLLFFSETFDCSIREALASPMDLLWLAAMWAGSDNVDAPSKTLRLQYDASQFEGLKLIDITVEGRDIQKLWSWVHPRDSPEFTLKEVTNFINALELFILDKFKLNLKRLLLCEISNASLVARSSGQIKFFQSRTSFQVICHLVSVVMTRYPMP